MWIDDIQLHRTKCFERQYIGTKPQSSRIMISIQHLAGNQWFRSLLLIVLLCGVAQAAPPLPDSPTSTERNVWATGCGQCEPSQCPPLPTEGCPQDVIKDACGCCDICDATNATDIIFATEGGAEPRNCAAVHCPRQQQCFLNIQGLPMCRCPSQYLCRRQPRREVCGRDGQTYRSRCYVQVAECTLHKKIRVAHRGPCYGKGGKKHPLGDEEEDGETTAPTRGRQEGRQRKKNKNDDGGEEVSGRRKENGRRDGRKKSDRKDGEKKNKKKRRRKFNKNNKKDKQRSRNRRRLLRYHDI